MFSSEYQSSPDERIQLPALNILFSNTASDTVNASCSFSVRSAVSIKLAIFLI